MHLSSNRTFVSNKHGVAYLNWKQILRFSWRESRGHILCAASQYYRKASKEGSGFVLPISSSHCFTWVVFHKIIETDFPSTNPHMHTRAFFVLVSETALQESHTSWVISLCQSQFLEAASHSMQSLRTRECYCLFIFLYDTHTAICLNINRQKKENSNKNTQIFNHQNKIKSLSPHSLGSYKWLKFFHLLKRIREKYSTSVFTLKSH